MKTADKAIHRPFRVLMYGLYLVVVVTFSLAVTSSVVKSVWQMSPKVPTLAEPVMSVSECYERASDLWKLLEKERQGLAATEVTSRLAEQWSQFRIDWLRQQRLAQAQCLLDSRERRTLRTVFMKLDRAMDLYTTHAVQFAGEVGPTVDDVKRMLNARTEELP